MIKTNCPKLVKNSIIPAIALLLLVPGIVNAATDSTINFQGKIVRNDTGYEGLNVTAGNPACVVDGNGNDTCDFQVKYYSASSGGTLLLTEVFSNVEIGQYNGAFTLSLGSDGAPTAGTYAACKGGTCDNLQEVVNAVSDLYVELGFAPGGAGSYTETFSRMPIQASAYALKAKYAEKASTAFQFDTAANSSGYTSPSAGMVYYDTTDSELKVYDGSSWGSLGGGTGSSLWTDGGIFTYLTALTDHFVLGSSSYTAIGADSYTTYLSGLSGRAPLSFDMTAERLTLSGSQAQSGLTVYSNYNSTGAWPVVTMKAEGSSYDNVVLQVVQDGTGNMLSLQKGSTEAFIFENPLTFYIHPRTDAPTVYANRLYNVNGTLYWNGSALGSGSSLWTDGGTFTYLTSTTDDVIIGGDSAVNAKFFFDVSTGNLGIGTSTPGAKLDIAGASSTISNSTGDITISPDDTVVIKANDTQADNLMEWQNSTGTVLGLINQNGYATFGGSTSNTSAILTLGASSGTVAQLNFTSGFDVSAPNTGDMWWNGTNLFFYDGSTSVDLLTSGGGGSDVLSTYGSVANEGYLNIAHNTNSYDVVADGWICAGGSSDESCTGGNWKNITDTDFTVRESLSNQWNDADSDGIIRSVIKLTDIELAPGINVGTGNDGDVYVNGSVDLSTTRLITSRPVGCADAVAYNITAFNVAGTEATVDSAPGSCLAVGDEVLVINLQGTYTAVPNVGKYETLRVSNVIGTTVTFTSSKVNYYGDISTGDTNLGTSYGTQRVIMQRVPNYKNITVCSGATGGSCTTAGTLTTSAWNGTKGGVIFFRASEQANINGSIVANYLGYQPGPNTGNTRYYGASGGESFCGAGGTGSSSGNGPAGAGGGGGYNGSTGGAGYCGGGAGDNGQGSASYGGAGGGAEYAAGGGGAGYGTPGYGGTSYTNTSATAGGNGGTNTSGNAGTGGYGAGGGGGTYGEADLSKLMFGSAGGGGTRGSTGSATSGGAGGGIVSIFGKTVSVSGSLSSHGFTPGVCATDCTGAGGGSGGSVLIKGEDVAIGTSLISVTKGSGSNGVGTSWAYGDGGDGGDGRIAIYYGASFSGTTANSSVTNSYQTGYYGYGIYNSSVISTPNAQSYDNITWDSSLNTYGKISVQTRSGATNDPTDGTWEEWRPYTSGTNYTTVESADTHTTWTGTNATVEEGDIGRFVDYFEDEDESTTTNITKVTSSTNGGYMESTISSTDLSTHDYLTLWVRASQTGNVLRIGMGESAGTEQYEEITIDAANTWQKVYWDLSDIASTDRDAITKIRLTNFSTNSNVIYLDNVRGESLLDVGSGSVVATTANDYFQYRVIFTTTNLAYQPQLESISMAWNSGYRIVMYDANNTRLYNYTGGTAYLRLDVVASTASSGSGGSGFINGLAVSHVEDGTNAIAFQFDTDMAFTNPTSKLMSVLNNGTEMMYLDADGNLYVSGTITAGKGLSVALVNRSGSTVNEKGLVTIDTNNDSSFTTTTIANMQGAMGIVQGVKIGSDLDSDGVCDNGDTCLVAFEGVVDVNLDNAASSSKGDYVYTSTTAALGHADASSTQGNGLIGVVTSTANSGSGYVQMVFNAQNKITADLYLNINIGLDKSAYRDMYNQLANDYAAMSDAERRGVVESNQSQSVMFDSFVDSLKMDSATSTVGVDGDAQKAGLWGGLTIDGTTTDIAGNRYLGSATATLSVTKYYDRSQTGLQDQDSTVETLVDLGVDPYWYNGASLQTATNLTTSYNGSLFTIAGAYATGSEHGYIDLTVTGITVSGLTADIASSDGNCSVTGASLTFGSAYSFGAGSCSGSTITVKPVRGDFKSGDKFRIASWYLEPTTTDDRGSERVFPQRSLIVASSDASYGYLTIINADTQRVWMKFTQSSTGEMLGVASNNTISSISMINGELSVGMNGSSATGMYSLQFHNDNVFKYNTSGKNLSNKVISDRNVANTYTVVNSNQALVSNIVNDVSSNVVWNKPTEETTVGGWGYLVGNGSNTILNETVYLPYEFDNIPIVSVTSSRDNGTTAPKSLADCTGVNGGVYGGTRSITNTNFQAEVSNRDSAVLTSGYYYCYTWTATGQVSPKMAVAVATGTTGTDGNASLINKSESLITNVYNGSQSANVIWVNKVALTANGALYIARSDDTGGSSFLNIYYDVMTVPSETTIASYRNGYYVVGTSGGSWTPVILGTAGTNKIQNLVVKEGTSTIDGRSNTIYVGTPSGISVIQEKQSGNATLTDGGDESSGSVQYYTKDYISEKMVGDIRGMWSLNGSGSIVNNSSITDSSIKGSTLKAHNTNGTGMSYVSGIRGTAISLDGVDDALWIDVNSNNVIDSLSGDDATNFDIITSNLGMGIWIKTSASDGVIMGKGLNDGNYTSYRSYDFMIASGKVKFNTFSGESYVSTTSNTSINDGQWHYIVGTFDNTTDLQSLYIDGQFEASTTRAGNLNNTASSFVVGVRDISGVLTYTAEIIDEPFVTATALTSSEIKSMYEEGLRALKGSHSMADTYNQLNGTSNDVRSILVTPDSKNMYVGTEGGGISKIDLTSSTRVNTYTTSTDPLTSTNNIETLSGRYYPILSGDIGSSARLMGIDSEGNDSTGTYYSRTVTFDTQTNKAYLWMSAYVDSSDPSSSITVSASNDGGSNYVTGTLVKTNTTGLVPEYEYSFTFASSDNDYKVKFEIVRGSSNKAAAYVTKWGLAQMEVTDGTVNGLFTQSNDAVANGSYLELIHGQNTYDLVTSGWVFDENLSEWVEIANTDNGITQNLSNQWNDADSDGIIRSIVKLTDVELAPGVNVGTGADGDITVSSNTNINRTNLIAGRSCVDGGDAVNYNITAFNVAGTEATLDRAPSYTVGQPEVSCLYPGDEVLIVNLQGTYTAFANVGNYETLRVSSINDSVVTFATAKTKYYGNNVNDDSNLGTASGTQRVMLQRVPNYSNVTVNASVNFYPDAWATESTENATYRVSKGGVMFFRASGVISVDGNINVNSLGYQGGAIGSAVNYSGGGGGESFCGSGGAGSTTAGSAGAAGGGGGGNAGGAGLGGTGYCGGGGGGSLTGGSGSVSSGGSGGGGEGDQGAGGGGGYGTAGGGGAISGATGGTNQSGNGGSTATWNGGGGGGGTYGAADLSKLLFGSAGGAGGRQAASVAGAGGRGGGIIVIASSTINVSGSMSSNGGGGSAGSGTTRGAGGGGAGGSIIISGNSITIGANLVSVSGGAAATGTTHVSGSGGSGRIAIYYGTSFSGTTANASVTNSYQTGYYSYGVYNSSVISTPNAQSYDNITWDSSLNTYGKISVQTRSGATNDPTDGTWEEWRPYTSGTNYTTVESADTHTTWTGTNATVEEGDIGRFVDYFEDEDESTTTNITKVTSSTNGGYMESTISSTDLSTHDYLTLWVRASQTGNVLRIGMGESAGTEQYEEITVDASNTWQKVYWDLSDITSTDRDAITKIRLTNFSTNSNVIYLDNVRGESLLDTGSGSVVATTPNDYFQYRVIFTTTNLSYQPQLENITFTYSSGFRIQIVDANTVRLYNNSGETQKLKLNVILGSAAIDITGSQYALNIAPSSAQIDGANYSNSIWINKMGIGGNLLRLQTNSVDMMVVDSTGNMTLAGDVAIGGSVVLGATGDQGTIRYNATDNRIEFSNDGISWMQLGDNTRAITLSAEYAGAVLSGDGSDNVGNMTSGNTGSSSNSMNYYEWTSAAVALNDYDVRVRFTLPSDFVSWGNGGIALNYATESTSNTNNKADMYIYLEGSGTVDGSSTGNASASAGVWTSSNVAGSGLDECNAAGETCVIILRMSSSGDNYTRIGDIDITYNRSL